MTAGDRAALDAIGRRLRHVAGTASMLADSPQLDSDGAEALNGIGAVLGELIERLDRVCDANAAPTA